jgi:hypothetical protein
MMTAKGLSGLGNAGETAPAKPGHAAMSIEQISPSDYMPAAADETAGYYAVGRLAPAEALIALPLCQGFYPQVGRQQWQRFVSAQEDSEAGVLVARDPFGTIHGLLCYRAVPDLTEGKAMIIDKIAVAGPVDRKVALTALLHAVSALAAHFNCTRLNAIIPEWRPAGASYRIWLSEALREAGLVVTAAILTCEVAPLSGRAD